MKKRSLSLVCVIALMLSVSGVNVRASEEMPKVDGSYLTHEEESTGESVLITRGEDLQSGVSKINKASSTAVNAGGITTADHVVDEIGVAVVVERARSGATSWTYYTSWQATRADAVTVTSSRRVSATSGYYYRVRCTHWANQDMSSSFTDGIYIG